MKWNAAVVAITHLNKNVGSADAGARLTGSNGFLAASRAAFVVTKDKDDEQKRLFLPIKNNLAEDIKGIAYHVEGVSVYDSKDIETEIQTSRIVWDGEVSVTANEALRNEKESSSEDEAVDSESSLWLQDFLKAYPEGVGTDIILKEALDVGFSRRTIYRAFNKGKIISSGDGFGKPRKWKLADELVDSDPFTSF